MVVYFFAETLGFDVLEGGSSHPPVGAVEITNEEYSRLFEGQSQQRRIEADSTGYPILVDQLEATLEVQESNERVWRNTQLGQTDGIVSRHRDEMESGVTTVLTAEQYTKLQAYRRQLRDWPQEGEFPLMEHRPMVPSWLESLIR